MGAAACWSRPRPRRSPAHAHSSTWSRAAARCPAPAPVRWAHATPTRHGPKVPWWPAVPVWAPARRSKDRAHDHCAARRVGRSARRAVESARMALMCGRYASSRSPADLAALFDAEDETDGVLAPDYNVAPTDPAPIVRLTERAAGRVITAARW